MRDHLASTLGAVEDDEPIHYSYQDCIKLAGHACPSVSAAFQLTKVALKELYGDEIPVRGGIEVRFAGAREAGANGPIGQVVQFLTGAAIETGFQGLGGRYSRANLFIYDEDFVGASGLTVEFRRLDTGEKVVVNANVSVIPAPNEELSYSQYMPQVVYGSATREEREKFYLYWQGMNRRILTEHHPGAFTVQRM
jgi:hypothetical protein